MSDLLYFVGWNQCLAVLLGVGVWSLCRTRLLATRPALAHGLWLLVLLKLVTPPVVPVPFLPTLAGDRPGQAAPLAANDETASREPDRQTPAAATAPPAPRTAEEPALAAPTDRAKSPSPVVASGVLSSVTWPAVCVALLTVSLLISAALWLAALHRLRQIRRLLRGNAVASPRTAELLREVSRLFRMPAPARLWIVDGAVTPMLWAAPGNTAIVLPRGLVDSLDDDALRAIIAHELAHLERRDPWSNLLALLVASLFWWNPIAWLARRELAAAAETSCDAIALARLAGSRKAYAETLLAVVDFVAQAKPPRSALGIPFGPSHSLRRRFETLAAANVQSAISRGGWFALAVGCLALTLVPARAAPPAAPSTAPLAPSATVPSSAAGQGGVAAEPTVAAAKPSAAELVERIIVQENAVDAVRSLYLRFEGRWTRPPAAIARKLARFKQQGVEIDVATHSDLWPEMSEALELAFDSSRVRSLVHYRKSYWDLRVFDGRRAIVHEKSFTSPDEHYALDTPPQRFFQSFWTNLQWLRMGAHPFWFSPEKSKELQTQINGLPQDYRLVGHADFRGRKCYVLENHLARRRIHVGVDDGQLHGLAFLSVPDGADRLPAMNRAAGRTFTSEAQWKPWLKGQTKDQKRRVRERLAEEEFVLMRPWCETFLDDYRQLAPGFWFPATQGHSFPAESGAGAYSNYSDAGPSTEVACVLRLVEAKVDQPLDDSLFTTPLQDGLQVTDFAYQPTLSYTQKTDRTPDEWQKIVDAYNEEHGEEKKENAARDALVGQPAPQLPDATWLNSDPLKLSSLKGKVLVLDFVNSACWPDLVTSESFREDNPELGVVVIGVYSAGSTVGDVKEAIQEWDLRYPLLIDRAAPPASTAPGLLASRLRVSGGPYAFVIDQEGRVAAHGMLEPVLKAARELAQKSKN